MRQHNFNLPKQMFNSLSTSAQNLANNKKVQNYIFNLNEILGQGNFSQVYKGINLTNNETVAIKVIEISKMKAPALHNLLSSEIEILQKIKHQNILNCIEVFNSSNNCYIVTQLCDGDLESRLKKTGPLEEKNIRKIIFDIFKGLKYLADEQIVHRDIKVANIFLKNGVTKVADFGFARKANQNFKDISIGSPVYMAPEGLLEYIYGPKTDVWAFGVVIFEILHGNPPLGFCLTQADLKLHITVPIKQFRFKQSISFQLRSLIMRCLEVDQRKRPTFQELSKHSYIQGLFKEFSKTSNFTNNQNHYPQNQRLGSLTKYPLSSNTLNTPNFGKFLNIPNTPNQHTRRPSIEISDFQGSSSSRPITFGSGSNLPILAKIRSTNTDLSYELIGAKISFQQALQLLHYCRLLFKTRELLLLQPQFFNSSIVDCYGNSILETITQLKTKLYTHVVFSGIHSAATQQKLGGVIFEYYQKYTSTILKKLQVRSDNQSLQSFSISTLRYLDSIPQTVINRRDQIIMSVYIKHVYDTNKILDTCITTKNYSLLLHDLDIEEFLKIGYESFDETYYIPIKAKLFQIEG